MSADQPDGDVYVVTDSAGAHLVCLDKPAMLGPVMRIEHQGAVHLQLLDQSPARDAVRGEPYELMKVRAIVIAAAVAAAVAGLVTSALLSPVLAVAIAVAVPVYLTVHYDRYATKARRRWAGRQRTLTRRTETRQFDRALAAVKTIGAAWPQVRPLVQIDTPRRELAAALWELADLLRLHQQLRTEWERLRQARAGLRPGAVVHAELADRIARVLQTLEPLWADIRRRVASLERLAAHCSGLARDEQAVAEAREAIRRADHSLGRYLPDGAGLPPLAAEQDFAERVQSVIQAYRELTGLD